GGALRRAGNTPALGGHSVEPDRGGETVAGRGGEPRVAPAEAEPDGGDRPARAAGRRAQPLHARSDVRLDALRRRLRDVVHVRKVVVPLRHAGRAPEVVEGDRRVPALGEAERELLVEAVEAAYVREDDDADAARLVGRGGERREAVPVLRLQHEILVRDGSEIGRAHV